MLKISEFSSLAKINCDTLQELDTANVLKPVYNDGTNGIDYYNSEQLLKAKVIVCLQEIGIKIKDIKSLLQEEISLIELKESVKCYTRQYVESKQELQDKIQQLEETIMVGEKSKYIVEVPIQIKKIKKDTRKDFTIENKTLENSKEEMMVASILVTTHKKRQSEMDFLVARWLEEKEYQLIGEAFCRYHYEENKGEQTIEWCYPIERK